MSGYTYVDLVPLDMKWACTCARKRGVVHTHNDEKEDILMKKGKFLIEEKGLLIKKRSLLFRKG